MKSVRDYIAQDMWGHCLMSGDAIVGCVTGETCKTAEEKLEYCKGIMTVFPHMLLANFSRWFWDGNPPRDYGGFMEASVAPLQAEVFPILEKYFLDSSLSQEEKGKMLAPVLTDLVPRHVLTGFYNYMFAGAGDDKDIADFWPTVEPLLHLSAKELQLVYAEGCPTPEKAEMFLFLGTRLPFLLIKRWYDWQFGKEKMEMPPPPPQD